MLEFSLAISARHRQSAGPSRTRLGQGARLAAKPIGRAAPARGSGRPASRAFENDRALTVVRLATPDIENHSGSRSAARTLAYGRQGRTMRCGVCSLSSRNTPGTGQHGISCAHGGRAAIAGAGTEKVLRDQEATRTRELAEAGVLVRLWRVPGRRENWGIWRADDAQMLHAGAFAFPLFPYLKISVHLLASHPNDPGENEDNTYPWWRLSSYFD